MSTTMSNTMSTATKGQGLAMGIYLSFLLVALAVQEMFSAGFSATITLTGSTQCLAFLMLLMKMASKHQAGGLSMKTLQLYVVMYVCRLTSTLFRHGYLPVDGTGDGIYQMCDIVALSMVCFMLYRIQHGAERYSYQRDEDSFPLHRLVFGCFCMAMVNHPDLNDSKFFDVAWTMALYVDTVALVPQLYMMSKGGEIEMLTGHFIASMCVSRFVALLFWYHGYEELAPEDGGYNITGWTIIGAHILQLLLSGDFLYYYVKAVRNGAALVLPTTSYSV